jgi:superfamily II DNA or RNA helicase
MKLTVINPVFSKITNPEMVKPLLGFQKEFWKKEMYRKIRKKYMHYMITREGYFFTGFIPRISDWAKNVNVSLEIENNSYLGISPNKSFFIKNITFRQDQISLINKAVEKRRGLLIAPTGSGKTIVAAGIISNFIDEGIKVLFLCHTLSLLNQTEKEFKKMGLNTSKTGAGEIDLSGQIVIAMMQTFGKLDPKTYRDKFDIVIVDEAHHISSETGTYHKILKNVLAPIRFGFTATPPTNPEAKLVCEGLIGPIIGETTMKEGKEKEFLSEPKVRLVSVPKKDSLQDMRLYKDIYDAGIVNNRVRNRMIANIVEEYNKEGKTCLVYVNRIEHLDMLMNMGNDSWEKVLGETEGELRESLRNRLNSKNIKCIVTTTVWKEGVNIPSLDVIINAAGGKSEISILQTIGRGLRRTKDKNTVVIVDFLDSGRYLSEHAIERLSIYSQNGWI